uniref:DUF4917 domain-containing protein n=1 Tax=Candidatus Kentrum sp. LPFa TaxID=2126335 RepID=A0A450WYP9_9GAMM|nr:MAG: protein of unknown function (DUF4917) [Candidatus Kentron sp. LPFa]
MMLFKEAIEISNQYKNKKRHVLLGNGFSIACKPNIFVYRRLFEQADFSVSPAAERAFEALNTQDFEHVIRALRDASKLVSLYEDVRDDLSDQIRRDADGLKDVLVNTIASMHPDMPGDISEEKYVACRQFLSNFDTVYTLNYDLLLYWAQMHVEGGKDPDFDDDFRKPEDNFDADYVTWEPSQSHGQDTWFLHGALHVFDAGNEVQKYTWINTGIRLIDQIRDALEKEYFPLFVAEGTSKEKYARIRHSDYLAKAYRSFSSIGGCLFIYGHSLADNDEHFLRRIEKGKVEHLFVGIHGDPESKDNKRIISKARRMKDARKKKSLEVSFYDSASVRVWG